MAKNLEISSETILANTPRYLVEYLPGCALLTIARKADGMCIAFSGRRIAGEFRDCLKTHTPERVCETYIRMSRCDWKPLYGSNWVERMQEREAS